MTPRATRTSSALKSRLLAAGVVTTLIVGAAAGGASARSEAIARIHYCDMLHTVWVRGATCAKARQVNLSYGRRCSAEILAAGAGGPISCNTRAAGYRCRSTGTAYDAVLCRRGSNRVRFQLAE